MIQRATNSYEPVPVIAATNLHNSRAGRKVILIDSLLFETNSRKYLKLEFRRQWSRVSASSANVTAFRVLAT